MFHKTGARKKKRLTDPVKIIPFPGQNLRDKVATPTKPSAPSVKRPFIEKPEPKVLKAPSGKLKTTNLSINKLMNPESPLAQESMHNKENLPRNDFSFDDIKMYWRQFAFELKKESKHTFYNAMIKREPLLQDDTRLIMEVDNEIQVDSISPMLPQLQGFIRQHVKNYEVTVEIRITEDQTEEVKYLNGKDKFAAMARKNPNLHTLKSTFNLDIEY